MHIVICTVHASVLAVSQGMEHYGQVLCCCVKFGKAAYMPHPTLLKRPHSCWAGCRGNKHVQSYQSNLTFPASGGVEITPFEVER